MQLKGDVTIAAPRQQTWDFLTDAQGVSKCAPGLETLEILEPDKKFRVVAVVGFGTVKVTFDTEVEWLELTAPDRARMKAHGNAPGSMIDATAEMVLSDADGGATKMEWTADVTVSGTIASLASRLMGSVTKKLTAAFFDCVKQQIEA